MHLGLYRPIEPSAERNEVADPRPQRHMRAFCRKSRSSRMEDSIYGI